MSKTYKSNGDKEKLRRWTQIGNGQLTVANGLDRWALQQRDQKPSTDNLD